MARSQCSATVALARSSRSRIGSSRGISASAVTGRPGSNAACRHARSSSCLSANARNTVPSAIPEAVAICPVVTAVPCSTSSGKVVATIAARRSSGVIAGARRRRVSVTVTMLRSERSLR